MIGCSCATCHSTDPRDRRTRPSIYLDVANGPKVLVDTGTDLRQQALAHNVTRVDAMLFTHSHADHIMGLDDVRRFNVMQGGAKLCAHFTGGDSLCLAYRSASHHYEGDKDGRTTPAVRGTAPSKGQDDQTKPKEEEHLAADVDCLESDHNLGLLSSLGRLVELGDRLRAEEVFSDNEEDGQHADDTDWQVDSEAPSPVRVGQVAYEDEEEA